MKTYSTEKSAKQAVKKQGLHLMNYRVVIAADMRRYNVVFFVHDSEDAADIQSRGFGAKIDPERAA